MVAELSGWDALWIALAGGAIATILGYVIRLFAVPSEIATNDRAIRDRDEDLERWVTDEHVRLKRALRDLREQLNKESLFSSGEYHHRIGLAKERAIQMYRDQESQALRDAARIRDREHWPHELWRQMTLQGRRELTVPARAKKIIDTWATPPTKHLAANDEPQPIDDPRARSLDSLLDEVDREIDEFQ